MSPTTLANNLNSDWAQAHARSLASEILAHPPHGPGDPLSTPMGVASIAVFHRDATPTASLGFVHSGMEYIEQHAIQH
jgi:hypothetical protein